MNLKCSLVVPQGIPTYRKIGRKPQRFDVGNGRMWTAQQIARHTGLKVLSVYRRMARGVTGEALLRPAAGWRIPLDVGGGKTMTAGEIAAQLGLHQSSVSIRISRGLRGRALLGKAKPDRRRKA